MTNYLVVWIVMDGKPFRQDYKLEYVSKEDYLKNIADYSTMDLKYDSERKPDQIIMFRGCRCDTVEEREWFLERGHMVYLSKPTDGN